MNWSNLFEYVSLWCFEHQVETDVIVIGAVILAVVVYLRKQRRNRRKLNRILRGYWMKRIDRENYQKMKFEDALGDAAFDMVGAGEMTPAEERKWLYLFADKYDFVGLIPQKNVKVGILNRLTKRFGLKPVNIPGDKPGVEKVDAS